MRSVFLGDSGSIHTVFSEDIRKTLESEAGLDLATVYKLEDLKSSGTCLKNTQFVFSTWGMPNMNVEDVREFFPKLEAVFYAAGSVQHFVKPLLQCGVRVFSAWAANAVPVAEFTLAQILLAGKRYFSCSAIYSNGDFSGARKVADGITGNYNSTVGIIGAGMIGKMVIKRLAWHDINVMVFDPFLSDDEALRLGVAKTSLQTLFSSCGIVSNHLANNAATVGMLNYELFSCMPAGGTFINTGRGAQIVEDDLCRALTERPDLTALLDVTFPEPPAQSHSFFSLPNILLSPHIAGSAGKEVIRMAQYMLEEYRRVAADEPCLYEVTQSMLEVMA